MWFHQIWFVFGQMCQYSAQDVNPISLCIRWHSFYCQTSDLGLRLEVDFVFPLSQQQEEEEEPEEQPSPKSTG